MTSGPRSVFVGNDIVDLADPAAATAAQHDRFLSRVLAPSERETVEASPSPTRTLWAHWAAKEAAFKAITKLRGEAPVFAHAFFVAALGPDGAGTLRFEDVEASVVGTGTDEFVHALAWIGPDRAEASARTLWGRRRIPPSPAASGGSAASELDRLLHPDEQGIVVRADSAWVRRHAREALAGHLGCPESHIRILTDPSAPGRTPPRLIVDGLDEVPDLTLSHHGHWVAWAFMD